MNTSVGFQTYDDWWRAIGQKSGLPYNPPLTRCTTTPIERISRDSILVGFGQEGLAAPPAAAAAVSPWALTLATSVVGAATGWVIEEFARKVRKKKRPR
jgi:hypothetical protein